jgi:hypothetical protein
MDFNNSFTVNVPVERVWALLLDAEQVAPCVPGAALTESIDPLHHRGTVKVKLGAVQMTYRGELEMEPDEVNRTIVLRARGSEARGGGGASGTFTTQLTDTGAGTQVDIHTRVDVTGRVAQFGRGIMQDVATRMIKDFASCLEQKVVAGETARTATASEPPQQPAPSESSRPTGSTVSAGDATPTRPSTTPTSQPATELRVGALMLDLARGRIARGLHAIARLIEPGR